MSDPLRGALRRIQNLLQIGRTTVAADDSGPVQTVQLKTSNAQTRDKVPASFHYGFSASMPVGTDVVVLNVSGDSTNGVIIASGHQTYRLKGLPAGGVALYDLTGSTVSLDGKGGIAATPSGGTFTVNGKLVVTGDATISGRSFLSHQHTGVEPGSGDTGAVV